MESQVLVALALSLVGGLSTSIGALFVIINQAPNLKLLGLLQGFAAGLMLSISFLDLVHNAMNSIGFLKGNLWFFAGVLLFALIVNFIPEPTIVPSNAVNSRQTDEDGSGKDLMKKHRRQVLFSGIVTAIGEFASERLQNQGVCVRETLDLARETSPTLLIVEGQPGRVRGVAQVVLCSASRASPVRRGFAGPGVAVSALCRTLLLVANCQAPRCRVETRGISLHNFPEGMAVFLGSIKGIRVGINLALAIALHNIPEGVAVALPIYFATQSKWQAFKLATYSGFAEPLGVVIMVGGVMAFLTLHEMLPLAFDYAGQKQAVKAVFVGMAFMAARLLSSR
ncbi:hypothetical protein Taro_039294 [Colocasia esculenta]|uniref:Zinc transporter ZTP29 n=1 Tax=Colocasia esculenta TaxID=4460 RepID=A0A843WVA9_COLES|nr:hypothetical protein [Colocasia esculenta]